MKGLFLKFFRVLSCKNAHIGVAYNAFFFRCFLFLHNKYLLCMKKKRSEYVMRAKEKAKT